MRLTEQAFTALVDPGCPKCESKRLTVDTYVAQKLPLLAGELFGAPSWGYKGEELVAGTYRIACADCEEEIWSSSACPKCDAADRLATALESENEFPLPVRCDCGSEQTTLTAYVPATVLYEGKRGAKARTQTTPDDEGFHGFKAECKQCRTTTERRNPCPLCAL